MSQDSSAKYYQDNKERLQKKAREKYQSLSKEGKEKNNNMVVNDRNIYQKIKKNQVKYRKQYYKIKKIPFFRQT